LLSALSHSHSQPFSTYCSPVHRDLPSFPTRRSSDLRAAAARTTCATTCPTTDRRPRRATHDGRAGPTRAAALCRSRAAIGGTWRDRKSTRLNSSHGSISYAVFCLKKKKQTKHYNRNV